MPAASRRSLMEGFGDMLAMSQIVIMQSSPKHHNLCVERPYVISHIVNMTSSDKNGGPNNLKAWREYRQMTQSVLAEAVGTNANMIGYLESGERALSAKWLRRLAPALRITPGFLLDHDPNNLTDDIIEIWTTADDRQKRQITEIAKTVVRTGTDD